MNKTHTFYVHNAMTAAYITVARFHFATDPAFQMFLALLENEGIPYRTPEVITIAIDPLLSLALGGIRVQVPESDEARALEILEQINTESGADETETGE